MWWVDVAPFHTGKLRHRAVLASPSSHNEPIKELESEQSWLVPFHSDWAKQVRCSQAWTNQHGLEEGRQQGVTLRTQKLQPGKSQEDTQWDLVCCLLLLNPFTQTSFALCPLPSLE